MQYTYEVYEDSGQNEKPTRKNVTTRFEEINEVDCIWPCYTEVYDNKNWEQVARLDCSSSYLDWQQKCEQSFAWKPQKKESPDPFENLPEVKISNAIIPNHYKSFLKIPEKDVDFQWLEALQFHPRFRDPDKFVAAVELQVRKYLDRNGQKDNELQETKKALRYLKILVAYMENGYRPINFNKIDEILKGI